MSEDRRGRGRRPQWRGERRAVLVRMPVEVADLLTRSAQLQHRSVSEHAAVLLAQILKGGDLAA